MDEIVQKKIPSWKCQLSKGTLGTVGEKLTLSCTGFDDILVDDEIMLELPEKQEYALNILSIKNNELNKKDFSVVSYTPGSFKLPLKFINSNKDVLFSSTVNLNVKSVIKNKADAKMVPPEGFGYVFPSMVVLIFWTALVLSILAFFTLTSYRKRKKRKEYKTIINDANYEDLFLDFNLEVRKLKAFESPDQEFFIDLEKTFKKVFFRIFNKNIFFNEVALMGAKLKIMGLPKHEVRSVLILKSEYEEFLKVQDKDGFELKRDEFLDQAKVVINKIKRYRKGAY